MLISLAKKKNKIVMLETYLKFDPRAFLIAFLPSDSGSARQFVFFVSTTLFNTIEYSIFTRRQQVAGQINRIFLNAQQLQLYPNTHIPPFCSTHSHTHTHPHANNINQYLMKRKEKRLNAHTHTHIIVTAVKQSTTGGEIIFF